MVEAAMSRPSSRAPASPMKILAGWKLWGRKPRQMPQVTTAMSGPMLSVGRLPEVLEVEAVDGQRPRGDGHHPGGQPVEPVDQVDGVGDGDDPQRGQQRRPLRGQLHQPGQGHLELEPGHPHEVEDGGGQHLAGHLGRGRHVPEVVDDPDHEDGRGPEDEAQRLRGAPEQGARAGIDAATAQVTSMATNMATPRPAGSPACAPCGRRAGPRSRSARRCGGPGR